MKTKCELVDRTLLLLMLLGACGGGTTAGAPDGGPSADAAHAVDAAVVPDAAPDLASAATRDMSAPSTKTATFPRLGNYSIGTKEYDNPAVIAHAALDDAYIVGVWNGWHGSSLDMPGIEAAISAQTTRGTKMISYFDPLLLGFAYPAYLAQMNSANFWPRQGWPSGAVVQAQGVKTADMYVGGPTGVGGRTYVEFAADYNVDWMFDGDAAGLATDGKDAPNPQLDGVYMDDMASGLPTAADWAHTGATTSGTDVGVREGELAIVKRVRRDKPGKLFFANLSSGQDPRNTVTEYVGQFDGGILEHMVGLTWSVEAQGNDFSVGVRAYQVQMSMLNENQLGIFSAEITPNGEDALDTMVPYQAFRNAFAMCLVVGDALCALTSSTAGALDDAAMWFDEESVDRTTGKPYTKPDASAAPGLGYLGTPVDPPQTAAYQNGYWRRRFQYGEVWWSPRGTAAGTIDFGRGVKFIVGTQAKTFNTGGSGTSHPIGSRDGIVVLY